MDVEAISGANIHTLHNFIKENKSLLKNYSHLLLHVGTNDIGNGLTTKLIIQYYNDLLDLIRNYNSSIKVIISSILPRPIDFEDTKNLVINTNNELSCLAIKKNVSFVKSYKPFVQQPGSIVKHKCYCRDKLHLSYLGVSLLRNFFIGVINHLSTM